jgi:hypothetical protein
MPAFLAILFAAAWLIVGFFVLRYVVRRRFADPERADTIAGVAAVVLAGAVFLIEYGGGPRAPAVATVSPAVTPTPAPQPTANLRDVSADCQHLKRFNGDGFGTLDGFESRLTGVLSDRARVSPHDSLTVVGWAGDHSQKRPARAVCLVVDGHVVSTATSVYGGLRPDVAAWKHIDALVPVGYGITIPAELLGRGPHTIRTAARSLDGTTALLLNQRTVVVK